MKKLILFVVGCLLGFIFVPEILSKQTNQLISQGEDYRVYATVSNHEAPAGYEYETDEWDVDSLMAQSEDEDIQEIFKLREGDKILFESGIFIPESVSVTCEMAGFINGVEPEILESICWVESTCNPNASNGSCKGIMQISEQWHKDRMKRLGVTSIYDEAGNIMVGADYIAELIRQYGSVPQALMAYNGDSDANKIDYMSGYAKKVIETSEILKKAHGK